MAGSQKSDALKGSHRYFSLLPESAGIPSNFWLEDGVLFLDCKDGIWTIDFNDRPERVLKLAEKIS